jgi:drug/metabolite transporter (DMT)-like permease
MRNDAAALPVLVGLIAIALLTGMDSLIKGLAPHYSAAQIAFMRSAMLVFWMTPVVLIVRPGWPQPGRLKAHALRAALMVITTITFFYALGKMPLAELFALAMTAPLFIALFSALFLREQVRPILMLALGFGFMGMLVVVYFGDGGFGAGEISELALSAALLSPVAYALGIVLLRSQANQEPATVIVLVQGLMLTFFLSPLAGLSFAPVSNPIDFGKFAAIGFLAAAGHLCITYTLSRIAAPRFAVLEYTGLLWAAGFGYVFFGEIPKLSVWLGAGLIIIGCVLVMRVREKVTAG